ncbi:MAG: hypothetical protein LBB42_05875 [Coriobacteriales bacterium]|nr:hypothetical protein [Coriobacteriales bacterium]
MRNKTIWTKALVLVALVVLGCAGLFACNGDKADAPAASDEQSSASAEATQDTTAQDADTATNEEAAANDEQSSASLKATPGPATVEELRAFLIASETDDRVILALTTAEVTSYPPVYVLTATMPTGALIMSYVLVKDENGIQKLFDFAESTARSTQEIVSCTQDSAMEITVVTKYSTYANPSAPVGETRTYSFIKVNGMWQSK